MWLPQRVVFAQLQQEKIVRDCKKQQALPLCSGAFQPPLLCRQDLRDVRKMGLKWLSQKGDVYLPGPVVPIQWGLRPNDILVYSLGVGLEPTNILTFLKKFGGTWCALPC